MDIHLQKKKKKNEQHKYYIKNFLSKSYIKLLDYYFLKFVFNVPKTKTSG